MGLEFLCGKESGLRQGGVDGRSGVSLAQNESIPQRVLGILRIDVQHIAVENGNNIRHRESRSDVRTPTTAGHVQRVDAYSLG